METQNQQSYLKKNSAQISLKLVLIGVLILLLLIPKFMMLEMIQERSTNNNVVEEQAKTWGGAQLLSGPILKIPYYINKIESQGIGKTREIKVKKICIYHLSKLVLMEI